MVGLGARGSCAGASGEAAALHSDASSQSLPGLSFSPSAPRLGSVPA